MTITQPRFVNAAQAYSRDEQRRNWSVFQVFNLSRLLLALLLLGVFMLDDQTRIFGKTNPPLFLWTGLGYITLVLLAIIAGLWRQPSLSAQAHFQALVDLVAISLFIHASGGLASNLSILLVTVVAASGILLPLYSALLVAALAFFILLGYAGYTTLSTFVADKGVAALFDHRGGWFLTYLHGHTDQLERVGLLGASCFIAALLTYTLAERTRRSEALVRQRSRELLELAQLNQAIVQHLQSGIIVVDQFARIRLMNDTAHRLLGRTEPAHGTLLEEVSPPLNQRLTQWGGTGLRNPRPFRQAAHLPEITASFSRLGDAPTDDTLVSLEDSSQVAQRLQQIKLAALGRMTAGIAHEIRNPLTSISHAAQLLQESTTVGPNDQRLGQIIHDNTRRANNIIASVLDLSRRDHLKPEDIALKPWLDEFCREFARTHRKPAPPTLTVNIQSEDLRIRFDPLHLHQVCWNLCSNACAYGTLPDQTPRIELNVGQQADSRLLFLDVRDFGPGISERNARKIFEPFFTTRHQGTGLGLYIAREICEANGAQLQYLRPPDGGSCFRITFARSNHQQETEDSSWTGAAH